MCNCIANGQRRYGTVWYSSIRHGTVLVLLLVLSRDFLGCCHPFPALLLLESGCPFCRAVTGHIHSTVQTYVVILQLDSVCPCTPTHAVCCRLLSTRQAVHSAVMLQAHPVWFVRRGCRRRSSLNSCRVHRKNRSRASALGKRVDQTLESPGLAALLCYAATLRSWPGVPGSACLVSSTANHRERAV